MNEKHFALMLAVLMIVGTVSANDLRVENVRLRDQDRMTATVVVEFDLKWEQSWRTARNHDAAWVFVKFRAPESNNWQHAWLATYSGSHAATDGVVVVGTTAVDGVPRGMGAFVYSADPELGTGVSVSYPRTRLIWDYGANGYDFARGDLVDVSVHAVEMVHVAQGSFYVGTGGTESGSFTDGGWSGDGASTLPFVIESEAELMIAPQPAALWGTVSDSSTARIGAEGLLPAVFPKGYAAFYCMKYNVTQGQYAAFLNQLGYAQQAARTPVAPDSVAGTYLFNNYRHRVRIATPGVNDTTPAVYATDAPYVLCNYLTWEDSIAILAWSGLRPMTELEYEKACRGPEAPLANACAWGTTQIKAAGNPRYTLADPGQATERIATAYETGGIIGNALVSANRILDAFNPDATADNPVNLGPTRAGIFATDTSCRVQSGASYWGITDLSGNLYERIVSVATVGEVGRQFAGSHGQGQLDATGTPVGVQDWLSGTHWGLAGGDYSDDGARARVSDRQNRISGSGANQRFGIRGVRTAP